MNTQTQTCADACTGQLTLYRAVVALPDNMAVQPRQERIVFFETCPKNAGARLEVMLGALWGADTEGWLERGLIYNLWSEKELFCSSEGKGDTRFFETGWSSANGIYYANPADIDMFVTPRTRARLDKALQVIATSTATRSAAAKHMLRRMQQDGRLAYLIDPLTTSYELLTQEVATATGEDVEQFREKFEATLQYTQWQSEDDILNRIEDAVEDATGQRVRLPMG